MSRYISKHPDGGQVKTIMRQSIFLCGLTLALSCRCALAQLPAKDDAHRQRIRETIKRSLPYLEENGVSWIEQKKCVTCHRVSFLTWCFSAADKHGFEIDRDKLREWNDWSVQKSLEKVKDSDDLDGSRNVDGLAQMLVGSASYLEARERQKFVESFLPLLIKGQREDGSWLAGGQLPGQKRPKPETDQVTTMWIALALGQISDSPEADQSRAKAMQWLEQAQPGRSIEWYSTRLLLQHQSMDADATMAENEKVKSLQNEDGGWGWLLGQKSDALATGQVLYGLSVAGAAPDDSAIRRAQEFLLKSQAQDGSWAVFGTKAAKQNRVEETATYWGTAWAVLGLLESNR